MRKTFYLFLAVFCLVCFIVGCRTVDSAINNFNACKNNAECSAQMLRYGNMSAVAVTKAVETLPITPAVHFAGLVGQSVGYVVSALVGVLFGKRLPRNL